MSSAHVTIKTRTNANNEIREKRKITTTRDTVNDNDAIEKLV